MYEVLCAHRNQSSTKSAVHFPGASRLISLLEVNCCEVTQVSESLTWKYYQRQTGKKYTTPDRCLF